MPPLPTRDPVSSTPAGIPSGDADGHASRRFTAVFLAVVAAALAATAAFAWYTDALHTFGTGHVGSFLTVEFDIKPESFLKLDPPPQAIVLGTSRAMKIKPECITEITGDSAFNFALTASRTEDWAAAYRFIRANSKQPIRELVIGADVDAFHNHAETEPRLLSSKYLRPYLDDSWNLSLGVIARALFGWQAFKYGMLLVWYEVHPSSRPKAKLSFDARGFERADAWDERVRQGQGAEAVQKVRDKLRGQMSGRGFDALSVPRVAAFKEMVRAAHAAGTTVDVFIPPLAPDAETLRSATIAARTRELEAMLADLDREGVIRLFRIHSLADFHGDPNEYYDGLHMTEANSTHLLLAMFHRPHGCGL
jgi:hypothetical protein